MIEGKNIKIFSYLMIFHVLKKQPRSLNLAILRNSGPFLLTILANIGDFKCYGHEFGIKIQKHALKDIRYCQYLNLANSTSPSGQKWPNRPIPQGA